MTGVVAGVVAGLDIGGTKTAVAVEDAGGECLARVEVPSTGWSATPLRSAAEWIARRLGDAAPGLQVAALGVGAQGCDTIELCEQVERALAALGLRARVVNDAALVVPAAGLAAGIGVIAGTGAIAVGRDAAGRQLFAGGWGWVLGDDAGAVGIVREATRAALRAHDTGAADDGLLAALQAAFGVDSADRLARAVNDEPTPENWGPRAAAVFAAAAHLTELVGQLVARGAVGDVGGAGGGGGAGPPRLARDLRHRLGRDRPGLALRLLDGPPVEGALALARGLGVTGR